jgi:hypothetical protein
MNISITKINKDCGCNSCNCCDVTNFESPFARKTDKPLYRLRIGYTVLCLCEDCLTILLKTIEKKDDIDEH